MESSRSRHFAGPIDQDKTHGPYEEVPDFQAWAVDCPSCGVDLHTSSGWDTRVCMLCGYIEGMSCQTVYPTALATDEWMFVVGMWYRAALDHEITKQELRFLCRTQITFRGSVFRPPGEEYAF